MDPPDREIRLALRKLLILRHASKARKNYRMTAKGARLLESPQAEVAELHRELAGNLQPDHEGKPKVNERRRT